MLKFTKNRLHQAGALVASAVAGFLGGQNLDIPNLAASLLSIFL